MDMECKFGLHLLYALDPSLDLSFLLSGLSHLCVFVCDVYTDIVKYQINKLSSKPPRKAKESLLISIVQQLSIAKSWMPKWND